MNSMKEIWMKGLSRTGWAGVLTAVFCVSNCSIAPLYGEDSEAATRQYNVAVSLQNREAYDLAIDAWAGFIKTYPTDSRVTHARHYQGVCYFFTAIGALDSKPPQTDAALKWFDAAEENFNAVAKTAPAFALLEDTYLYLGLSQFKRAEIGSAEQAAKQYAAAAATFDTLLKSYPQSRTWRKCSIRGVTARIMPPKKTPPYGSTARPSPNRRTRNSNRRSCMPWA